MKTSMAARDMILLAVLAVDAVLLAILELLYLPLRWDGVVLPRLGDVPFPVTALLAALTTPLLVLGAVRLTSSRRWGTVPLGVWLLTLLVLGTQGPGGGTILLVDWRSPVLLIAGALPAALVLGRLSIART